MGFIEQLIGLLHASQKSSHEHVIGLLVYFVTDYPQGIKECHRPEFNLKELLKTKIAAMKEEDPERYEVSGSKGASPPLNIWKKKNKTYNIKKMKEWVLSLIISFGWVYYPPLLTVYRSGCTTMCDYSWPLLPGSCPPIGTLPYILGGGGGRGLSDLRVYMNVFNHTGITIES